MCMMKMMFCCQRRIFRINDLVRFLGTEGLTAKKNEAFDSTSKKRNQKSHRKRKKSEKAAESGQVEKDEGNKEGNAAKMLVNDVSNSNDNKTEEILNETPELPGEMLKETQERLCKESYESVLPPEFCIQNIMMYPLHVAREHISSDELVEEIKIKKCPFPSVTTVLKETMSEQSRLALVNWKLRMIKEMGESKFQAFQEDPAKKVKLKISKSTKNKKILIETLDRGSKFHTSLKQYLTGTPLNEVNVPKEAEGCWESVKSVLPFITDVKMVESGLFHPILHYKGIVDCVASYRNVPHVIEWKQSQKVKKTLIDTHDAPIQLSAYMGALSWIKKMNLNPDVVDGLVVVAYTNGSPAKVFPMNSDHCQCYWESWLRRLQHFWWNCSQSSKKNKAQL